MNIQPVGRIQPAGQTNLGQMPNIETGMMDKMNAQSQQDISEAELLAQKQILFEKQKEAYAMLLRKGQQAADIFKADVMRKYKDDVDQNGNPIVLNFIPPPEPFLDKTTGSFDPQKWMEHAYVGVTKYEEDRAKRKAKQESDLRASQQLQAVGGLPPETERDVATRAAVGATGTSLEGPAKEVVSSMRPAGFAEQQQAKADAAKALAEYRKKSLAIRNKLAETGGSGTYTLAQAQDDLTQMQNAKTAVATKKASIQGRIADAREAIDGKMEFYSDASPEEKAAIDKQVKQLENDMAVYSKQISGLENDEAEYAKNLQQLDSIVKSRRKQQGFTPAPKPTGKPKFTIISKE